MERYERGMLAWSRAGHDCGQLYVITDVQGEYVFLSDGRLKPLEKPKKKKEKRGFFGRKKKKKDDGDDDLEFLDL